MLFSLTANCLDGKFKNSVVVLRVKSFAEAHTSDNIAKSINETLEEYEIPNSRVHFIVHDNAANMIKAVSNMDIGSLTCFLHTLQLIIKDAIFEQRVIRNIIANCRQITGHFNHSPSAYNKLRELQKQQTLPVNKLIQDVATRWNSTFAMLERIFEQKCAIAAYCAQTPNMPVFDANKWDLIGKCSKMLKIFHETTLR